MKVLLLFFRSPSRFMDMETSISTLSVSLRRPVGKLLLSLMFLFLTFSSTVYLFLHIGPQLWIWVTRSTAQERIHAAGAYDCATVVVGTTRRSRRSSATSTSSPTISSR